MGTQARSWLDFVASIGRAPGHLPRSVRRAVIARAAGEDAGPVEGLSPLAAAFADKVAESSYKVTDADVQRLLANGMNEDEVYELIVAAAVGAGHRRWRAVFRS